LSTRLIALAGISGRSDARQAVIAAQPNAGHLQVDFVDRLHDRFLDRLPPPAVSSTPAGQRQRYWGAR